MKGRPLRRPTGGELSILNSQWKMRRQVATVAAVLVLAGLLVGVVRADKPAVLRIEINARQPAEAPVILKAKLTNTFGKGITDRFESPLPFRAFLTGPDARTRCVCITNSARFEGSFGLTPTLKPGQTVETPLRLTKYTGADWRRYLPSEHVYLRPGKYQLRLERFLSGPNPTGRLMATGTTKFTVVRDAALAKARFAELRGAPKDRQRFFDAQVEKLASTTVLTLARRIEEKLKPRYPELKLFNVPKKLPLSWRQPVFYVLYDPGRPWAMARVVRREAWPWIFITCHFRSPDLPKRGQAAQKHEPPPDLRGTMKVCYSLEVGRCDLVVEVRAASKNPLLMADLQAVWADKRAGRARRLTVYDVKADRKIADLPTDRFDTSSMHHSTSWTGNRGYLCYPDTLKSRQTADSSGDRAVWVWACNHCELSQIAWNRDPSIEGDRQ